MWRPAQELFCFLLTALINRLLVWIIWKYLTQTCQLVNCWRLLPQNICNFRRNSDRRGLKGERGERGGRPERERERSWRLKKQEAIFSGLTRLTGNNGKQASPFRSHSGICGILFATNRPLPDPLPRDRPMGGWRFVRLRADGAGRISMFVDICDKDYLQIGL